MTEAEALAWLRTSTAADDDPALTEDELFALLTRFRVADADGYGPADAEWTPTWHLPRAAGEGWKQKAAKAASRYYVMSDGQGLSRNMVITQCLQMAEVYFRGAAVAVALPGGYHATETETTI